MENTYLSSGIKINTKKYTTFDYISIIIGFIGILLCGLCLFIPYAKETTTIVRLSNNVNNSTLSTTSYTILNSSIWVIIIFSILLIASMFIYIMAIHKLGFFQIAIGFSIITLITHVYNDLKNNIQTSGGELMHKISRESSFILMIIGGSLIAISGMMLLSNVLIKSTNNYN